MAAFNSYIPTKEDSYIGYSKGVEGPKPNLAASKFLEGTASTLGEGIQGGVQLLDVNIENAARDRAKELNTDVDNLAPEDAATLGRFKNKALGDGTSPVGGPTDALGSSPVSSEGGGATLLPGSSQNAPATPVEVTKGIDRINKLYQAYQEGTLSPTYSLVQQQVVAQQLKQRFPNSEKQIDEALHRETRSANEIRQQVYSDFQAASGAANTARRDYEHYVRGEAAPYLGAAGVQLALSPEYLNNKVNQYAIYAHVGDLQKINKDRESRQADINLKRANNSLTSEDAEHALTLDAQGVTTSLFKGAFSPLGKLQASVDAQLAKGKPDEEFIMQSNATLTQLQRGAEAQIDALIAQHSPDIKDPVKIAKIREQALVPFERIRSALGTGNITLASWHTDYVKRTTDRGTAQELELSPTARFLAAVKPLGDQNLITTMLQTQHVPVYDKDGKVIGSDTALKRFWDDSLTIFQGNAMGKANPGANLGEVTTPRPAAPGLDKAPPAKVINQTIDQLKTNLTSPEASSELKANTIDYIVNDKDGKFFKNLDKSSQVQALNLITSPDISKAIHSTGDTDRFNQYKDWTQNTVNTHIQARAGDIQTLTQNKQLGFIYNTETGQLDWNRGAAAKLDVNYPELQTAVQLNGSLRNLHSIYKLDKTDMNEKVIPLLKGMGVTITNPIASKEGNLVEDSKKAIPYTAEPQTPAALQAINNALKANLEPGKPESHIIGMSPELKTGLAAMLKDAPEGIEISSGHRSTERQKEIFAAAVKKYGSVEAARKWAAPPGNSFHETGHAADLHFATPAARDWVHANAKKYGLNFPLSNEPWHIEPMGVR